MCVCDTHDVCVGRGAQGKGVVPKGKGWYPREREWYPRDRDGTPKGRGVVYPSGTGGSLPPRDGW